MSSSYFFNNLNTKLSLKASFILPKNRGKTIKRNQTKYKTNKKRIKYTSNTLNKSKIGLFFFICKLFQRLEKIKLTQKNKTKNKKEI